jgi:hypothetical protein
MKSRKWNLSSDKQNLKDETMLCMVGQYHDRLHDRRLEDLDEDSLLRILERNPDSSTISVVLRIGGLELMTRSHETSFACMSSIFTGRSSRFMEPINVHGY